MVMWQPRLTDGEQDPSKLDGLILPSLHILGEHLKAQDQNTARHAAEAVKFQIAQVRAGKVFPAQLHEEAIERLFAMESSADALLRK